MVYNFTMKKNYYVGNFKSGFEKSNGWFVGSFLPEGFAKTNDVELKYFNHIAGEKFDFHKHNKKIEIGIILSGKMKLIVNNEEFIVESGQFWFAEKGEVVMQEFLEKTEGFAIHAPCVPSDKEIVDFLKK